jgi:hypothetical protein
MHSRHWVSGPASEAPAHRWRTRQRRISAPLPAKAGRAPLSGRWHRCILARAPEGVEILALHPQQPGFDRGGPAKSPEERREAMHELLFDRRLRQILRENCVLERPILLWAFERLDDGLGRESMPQGVPPGPRFPSAVFGPVLLSAFWRFASIWRRDVMGASPRPRRLGQLGDFLQRPPSTPRRLGVPKLAKRSLRVQDGAAIPAAIPARWLAPRGAGSGRMRGQSARPRNGLAVQVWRIEVILAGNTDQREEGVATGVG